MAKANYTKVEEALNEGLLKMTMEQLHALTDGKPQDKDREQGRLVAALKFDFEWISKNDPSIFTQLGLKKSEMKELLKTPSELTPDDWKALLVLKSRIDGYKKEFCAQHPAQDDQQLIEKERIKHINKRFNTNEKWLPLQ